MTSVRAILVGAAAALLAMMTTVHAESRAGQVQSAQLAADGSACVTSSNALKPVPDGLAFRPRGYSDTDMDLLIKDTLETALQRADHAVAADGQLQLDFESRVLSAERAGSGGPSLGRVDVGGSAPTAPGVEAMVNVWSTTQDSLLRGRQKRAEKPAQSALRIDLQLRDRRVGKVLWQGHAACEMLTSDNRRLVRSMVPQLVQNLGQTVRNESFDIQ